MRHARDLRAEVLLPGHPFEETLAFFLDLGFVIEAIGPADAPSYAALSAFGLRVRIDAAHRGASGELRLLQPKIELEATVVAPNGTRIHRVPADPPVVIPTARPEIVVRSPGADGEGWTAGRAGMAYRDLIPCRWGGRYIASHIRIERGGPVPDYVHFHRVAFQVIVCLRGDVEVVYEDQGEPFALRPGDAVIQPPEIRHRVLSCSDRLEVLEVGSPAVHETRADPALELPTAQARTDREYDGQRFVHHKASSAAWLAGPADGWTHAASQLGAASRGAVGLRQHRAKPNATWRGTHEGSDPDALRLWFVRAGDGVLSVTPPGHATPTDRHPLGPDGSAAVPARSGFEWTAGSDGLELIEVTAPAAT